MKILSESKDIIWCPSQIYIFVQWNNRKYQIYARWRHHDPWEIYLSTCIQNPYGGNMYPLNTKKFTDKDDIDEIVDYMKSETEILLIKLFPKTK